MTFENNIPLLLVWGHCKQINTINRQKRITNLNRQEADQLAIYKAWMSWIWDYQRQIHLVVGSGIETQELRMASHEDLNRYCANIPSRIYVHRGVVRGLVIVDESLYSHLIWPENRIHSCRLSCTPIDFQRAQNFHESRWAFSFGLARAWGEGGTPIHYLYGYVPPNGVLILKFLI